MLATFNDKILLPPSGKPPGRPLLKTQDFFPALVISRTDVAKKIIARCLAEGKYFNLNNLMAGRFLKIGMPFFHNTCFCGKFGLA